MTWPGIITIALLTMSPFPATYLSSRWQVRDIDQKLREATQKAVRRGFLKLALANAATVGVMTIWLALDWNNKHSYVGLVCFHIVWWPFAVPVLRELESALSGAHIHSGSIRAASLKPRTVSDYLPWWWTWAFAAALVILPSISFVRLAASGQTEARLLFGFLFMTITGISCIASFPLHCRRFLERPYPSLHGNATQLADEIETQRREWLRIWFGLHLALSNVLMIGGLLFVEVARGTISEETAGVVGGSLGTVAGITGGVFGVWFSRRAQARKRLLNRQQNTG